MRNYSIISLSVVILFFFSCEKTLEKDQALKKTQEMTANIPITWDTQDPLVVGQQTILINQLINTTKKTWTNVQIKCRIAEEMKYVSAEPKPSRVEDNMIIFPTIASVHPKKRMRHKVTCKAIKEGSAKTIFILTYAESKLEYLDEEGTSIYKP